jgi:hypothetical protein
MNRTLSGSMLRAGCVAAALAGGLAAPGAFAQRHGHYIGGIVVVAPPQPQVEVRGEPPRRGDVYENGYWRWVDGRHVWVPGHWMAPRRGYNWEPHVWVREGKGWRMREGYWARR